MKAKQYLRKIRDLDKEISATLDQIEILHSQVTKTTSVMSDTPKGQGEQDQLGTSIAKIVDLKKDFGVKLNHFVGLKAKAVIQIDSLEDNRHKLVLTHYYLNQKTWEETAVAMNYSYRRILDLHGQALVEFQKILDKEEMHLGEVCT